TCQQLVRWRDTRPLEYLAHGRAPVLTFGQLPQFLLGREDGQRGLGRLASREMACADRMPERLVIDAVPGREGAAPVEDDCLNGHAQILCRLPAGPRVAGPAGRAGARGPARGRGLFPN